MMPGIFIGHHERTGSLLFMTPEGIKRGSGVHRLPQNLRWDLSYLRLCKGLPWEMKPSDIPLQQPMFGDGEASIPIVAATAKPAAVPKNLYVLRADVEKYGYTDGCPACTDLHLGGKVRPGFPHSSECRERIFEMLQKDQNQGAQARLQRYMDKRDESENKRVRVQDEELQNAPAGSKEQREMEADEAVGAPIEPEEMGLESRGKRARDESIVESAQREVRTREELVQGMKK